MQVARFAESYSADRFVDSLNEAAPARLPVKGIAVGTWCRIRYEEVIMFGVNAWDSYGTRLSFRADNEEEITEEEVPEITCADKTKKKVLKPAIVENV